MVHALEKFLLIFQLALRNVFARRWKSVIVGSIIFSGSFLVVTGDALLDSLQETMARSIVRSIVGHLQVYSKDAKDPLDLFPSFSLFDTDFGTIMNFEDVRTELETIENVEAVVPMGPERAIITFGNELDRGLSRLRDEFRQAEDEGRPPNWQEIDVMIAHVRLMIGLLEQDYENVERIARDKENVEERRAQIRRALSDAFWAEFRQKPLQSLEFLENRIAPLSYEGRQTFMLYLGTDMDRFAENFDLFEIVDGQRVPEGQRGMLFSKLFYETQIKHPVATQFDQIHEAVVVDGRSIAAEPTLRESVRLMSKQFKRITYELDPEETVSIRSVLQSELGTSEQDISKLVEAFLVVDDTSVARRHELFYEHVAPRISLYSVNIGDVFTLKTFTKSGYLKSVNVKVYGTYRFMGLEDSILTGVYNLIDLMTFRDLYGYMTDEKREEMAAIKEEYNLEAVDRSTAEDELFGGGSDIVSVSEEETDWEELVNIDIVDAETRFQEQVQRVYTREEIENGVFINAAVLLKDPSKLEETKAAIAAKSAEAGLNLEVLPWDEASGFIGRLVSIVRVILFICAGIIFLVALVIINNSMVLATLERVNEIGSLRAMGAGKGFVLLQFMLETFLLGMIAGSLGAFAGAGFITFLGSVGIPATNEFFVFFFGGKALYPTVTLDDLALGFVIIIVVSVLSTLYPSIIATRTEPVEAMRAGE